MTPEPRQGPTVSSYNRGTFIIAAGSLLLALAAGLSLIAWAKSYSPAEVANLSPWLSPVVKTFADSEWYFLSGASYTLLKIFILWGAFALIGLFVRNAFYGYPGLRRPYLED